MRKKTRDEDLAKRAKKLLRNWQKLIDPEQPEVLPSTLISVMGSNWSQSLPVSKAPQTATDNDKKPVLQSIHSSSTEKLFPIKHTGKQKVEINLPTLNGTKRSALSSASGSTAGPEELQIHNSVIKPHFSSPELTAPTILRKPVLQQQRQRDLITVEKLKHKAHSHYTNLSPRKQLALSKQTTSFSATDSEPLSVLPIISSIQVMHTECHQSKDPSHPENDSLSNSERTREQINNLQNKPKELAQLQPGLLSEVTNMETEKDIKSSEGKRRKPQLKDYTINMEGRSSDDLCKPARVKNRKLTFDPFTQQIRPLAVTQAEEQHNPAVDINEQANLNQSPSASSPSALQKKNWKDMSQNEIVKYYLNLQNNLLKTSGSQVSNTHFFMTEFMKCEEDTVRKASKAYVQVPNVSQNGLPGINRDITTEDVHKINSKHWPGVNGCYDSNGHWYDWTECISLDTYGDGNKLDILPYVCID